MKKADSLQNLPPRVLEELSSRLESHEDSEELMSRVVTSSGKRLSELNKQNSKLSTKYFLRKHLSFFDCF
ncbi:MAG: hypothetical protein ACK4K0_10830 [Flavobacteriales bacterium]